jgi:hypothetical protein
MLLPRIDQQKPEDRGNGDRHREHCFDVEFHGPTGFNKAARKAISVFLLIKAPLQFR